MNPTKHKERKRLIKEQIPNPLLMKKKFMIKDSNREKKPCKICGKPMLVAVGEDAKYHKECRKFRHNKSKHEKN